MEWTGQVYAVCPAAATQILIDAPPERVWDLVSEIELMAELSSELQEVAWLDGGPETTGPAVGRRFTGRNAHPAATWRFTLKPDREGTLLEQWYQMGPGRSGLNIAIDAMPDKEQKIVFVRLREHETGMRHNLAEIKDRAERAG